MIKLNQIPPAALEAMRTALEKGNGGQQFYLNEVETAAIALLEAWPGMRLGKYRDVAGDNDRIILPLTPQENSDDQ